MKKATQITILMITTIFLMTITALATGFAIDVKMENEENEYTVKLLVKELSGTNVGINVFACDFEYDRDTFETVKTEDITLLNGWESFIYNAEAGTLVMLRSDFMKDTDVEIAEIKLTQKENANASKTEIKLSNIQASDAQNDLDAPDKIVKVQTKNTILTNILMVALVVIIVLFVIKLIIKTQAKRRKRR